MDQGLQARSPNFRESSGRARFATDQVALAPWDRMVQQVARRGWASIPGVVQFPLSAQLLGCYQETGAGRTLARSETAPVVADLAVHLEASLSVAAELQGLPPPPMWNRVTWLGTTRPVGVVLRAPWSSSRVGITALVGLCGAATLRVADTSPRGSGSAELTGGSLVLLRAGGWPRPRSTRVAAGIDIDPLAPVVAMVLEAVG